MNLVDIYCKQNKINFKFWGTHPVTVDDLLRFAADNNLMLSIIEEKRTEPSDAVLITESIVYKFR